MTVLSSGFSARGMKPEGQYGRRPTVVRMMRDHETLTGSSAAAKDVDRGGRTRVRGAQPPTVTPSAARPPTFNSVRRVTTVRG
jgi:hypothetical protein